MRQTNLHLTPPATARVARPSLRAEFMAETN